MITVLIDELTPCLKDNKTGQLIETEVMRVRRKSVLSSYNKKNGWYENWAKLFDENEVYALVIKGTYDIQGLVAVSERNEDALFISWMVTAPQNNHLLTKEKRYNGVGGHLFAIATHLSKAKGYNGNIYGFAMNNKLLSHYVTTFNATPIGMLHKYHFIIEEEYAEKIEEVYTYDFKEKEI
jgi:hypothetical protein